jgi:hypothetical protein
LGGHSRHASQLVVCILELRSCCEGDKQLLLFEKPDIFVLQDCPSKLQKLPSVLVMVA